MKTFQIVTLHENGSKKIQEHRGEIEHFISTSLEENFCTLVRGFSESWTTDNSRVTSLPVLNLLNVFKDADVQLATASVVEINGPLPEDEGVHYHLSHVVGMVFEGVGSIISHVEGESVEVHEGDLVIIPRGVMHFFTSTPGHVMRWVAMEVSDRPIDYQKHFDDYERKALKT
jgi:mannose-6-phosphate isomerase-like protein (cupin superfamily)